MVLIGISEERVCRKRIIEFRIEIQQLDDIQLKRICLIEEAVTEIAVVAISRRQNVPGVFRTVLIVVRKIDFRTWNGTFKESVWQREEFRKAQSGRHTELIGWASFNRRLIGMALGNMAACELTELLNATHNSITAWGENYFIHRKGARNVESGSPVIVAGSRGTYSYLVAPTGDGVENIHSIAHGAGRKWNRQSTRDRVRAKHDDMQQLLKTKLGTDVICPDKTLLYEEAPEAYKDVSTVIEDLKNFKLATALAELCPLVNIKP